MGRIDHITLMHPFSTKVARQFVKEWTSLTSNRILSAKADGAEFNPGTTVCPAHSGGRDEVLLISGASVADECEYWAGTQKMSSMRSKLIC